jgi:nitric oxide reductase NorD protein
MGNRFYLLKKLKKIITSIIQDNGSIPQDYLLSPGNGENLAVIDNESETSQNAAKSQEPENKIFFYPEWDYRWGHYYKNWCVLREVAVPLQSEPFVTDTLQRYYGLLKTLRRTFEM